MELLALVLGRLVELPALVVLQVLVAPPESEEPVEHLEVWVCHQMAVEGQSSGGPFGHESEMSSLDARMATPLRSTRSRVWMSWVVSATNSSSFAGGGPSRRCTTAAC